MPRRRSPEETNQRNAMINDLYLFYIDPTIQTGILEFGDEEALPEGGRLTPQQELQAAAIYQMEKYKGDAIFYQSVDDKIFAASAYKNDAGKTAYEHEEIIVQSDKLKIRTLEYTNFDQIKKALFQKHTFVTQADRVIEKLNANYCTVSVITRPLSSLFKQVAKIKPIGHTWRRATHVDFDFCPLGAILMLDHWEEDRWTLDEYIAQLQERLAIKKLTENAQSKQLSFDGKTVISPFPAFFKVIKTDNVIALLKKFFPEETKSTVKTVENCRVRPPNDQKKGKSSHLAEAAF